MPYFKWSGVAITGDMRYGTTYARSSSALDAVLFKNDIALLTCKNARWRLKKNIPYKQRAFFCNQLATLLKSGIRLYDALMMSCIALTHKDLRFFVQDCALQVYEGVALSKAMHEYRDFFDDFVIQMIYIGEESGDLKSSLEKLAITLSDYNSFNKRLRAALIMPCITFVLFILLFCVIFYAVIPRFQVMLQGQDQIIPTITRVVFAVSNGLRSAVFFYVLLASGLIVASMSCALVLVKSLCSVKERLLLYIPGIGYLINEYSRIQFLQALGVLLDGGVPLVKSLTISADFIPVTFLKKKYLIVAGLVQNGALLADALAAEPLLHTPELDAFIKAGFTSGSLSSMIAQATLFYKEQLHQRISFCITLIQPVMLSVMGLLVAALIIALYMPLFTFSSIL